MTYQTDESGLASLDSLTGAAARLRAEIGRRGDAAPVWMHAQLVRLEQTIEDHRTGPDGTNDNYEAQGYIDTPWWAWCMLAGCLLGLGVVAYARWLA